MQFTVNVILQPAVCVVKPLNLSRLKSELYFRLKMN